MLTQVPILSIESGGCPRGGDPTQPAQWAVTLTWPDIDCIPRFPSEVAETPTVSVRIEQGRWLAECWWCGGLQRAARTDHRFLCDQCYNAPAEGKWLRTVWPEEATEIERLLIERPVPNRNWRPGESVDDLRRENAAQ